MKFVYYFFRELFLFSLIVLFLLLALEDFEPGLSPSGLILIFS